MARHRMAVCDHGPKWVFLPPQSTCAKYQPAPAAVVQARAAWLAKVDTPALSLEASK